MRANTVKLEFIPQQQVIKLTLAEHVVHSDMQRAMSSILVHLEESHDKHFIVVDMTKNNVLSVQATVSSAFFGPYGHPNVAQWLIVGHHPIGKRISRQLIGWTGESRFTWFDDTASCLKYILTHKPADFPDSLRRDYKHLASTILDA
ncbi:MAG: hypothetical protein AAF126_00840 [Chloroflexota bacterium]